MTPTTSHPEAPLVHTTQTKNPFSLSIQPIQAIDPQPLPIDLPQVRIDPTNPLSWIIVFTFFLSTTEKPMNAMAKLLDAISNLMKVIASIKRFSRKKSSK